MSSAEGFGKRLQEARRTAYKRGKGDVSKAAVARAADVTPQAAGVWEKGEHAPDIETIAKVAVFLGVDPGWLAFGGLSRAPAPTGVEQPFIDPSQLEPAGSGEDLPDESELPPSRRPHRTPAKPQRKDKRA